MRSLVATAPSAWSPWRPGEPVRVVAGTHRGRRLVAPTGRGTRPTSDRVREAVFSSLGDHVAGARVLDLFAGSGAMGIEALSRGAAAVTFVEQDRRAAAVIERNLDALGLVPGPGGAVVRAACGIFCGGPTGGPFSVVLADPPYAVSLEEVLELLTALQQAAALHPGARVVVERARRDPQLRRDGEPAVRLPGFLAFDRARSYGDTVAVHLVTGGVRRDGSDRPATRSSAAARTSPDEQAER